MDMHTATEVSYKNGYEAGYEKAKEEFFKTGKWTDIYMISESNYIAVCSNCKTTQKFFVPVKLENYCPICGSRNVVEKNN